MQNSEIIAVVLTSGHHWTNPLVKAWLSSYIRSLRASWAQFWKSPRKKTPSLPGSCSNIWLCILWRIFPLYQTEISPLTTLIHYLQSFIKHPWEVWVHPLCHRIIQWVELAEISKIISFQSPALDRDTFHQTRFPQALSNLALNISGDGAATIYPGKLFPSIS